jgi:hypothetical protein
MTNVVDYRTGKPIVVLPQRVIDGGGSSTDPPDMDDLTRRVGNLETGMEEVKTTLQEIRVTLAKLPTKGDLINYSIGGLAIGLAIMGIVIGGIIGGLSWIRPDAPAPQAVSQPAAPAPQPIIIQVPPYQPPAPQPPPEQPKQ